jgi:hypothetical protein
LKALEGKVNVVYWRGGAFFPLSDYEGQVKIVEKIIAPLKPTKGAMVLGRKVEYSCRGDAKEDVSAL